MAVRRLGGRIVRPSSPGPHRDIDLLYAAQSFARLDEFLRAQSDVQEVTAKRFSHKRAFEWRGLLVEMFLVRSDAGMLLLRSDADAGDGFL